MALNAPTLVEPRPGETRTGTVKFAWQPRGTLPDGTAYEVVWWNPGEDPATARGIAATTTQTSLTADLDGLYATGQFPGRDHYWTVIVVQTAPYVRLMQPAQGAAQLLTYDAPSGGSQSPPPKPRD